MSFSHYAPPTSPGPPGGWTLEEANTSRRARGLFRERLTLDCAQGPEVIVDGERLLSFCSNDYLGLANHPAVREAFQSAVDDYGVGAGASHLVCGHQRPHHELEQALARFTQRDRALVFSSGYQANLGTLTALLQRGDAVFQDRLNHASLLDGGLLSGARFRRYRHCDPDSLAKLLAGDQYRRCIAATDGVFSMDGDIAPLPRLAEICARSGACLMVDDAHGLGVLGSGGRGTLEHFGLSQAEVPILMGTLGKAFGVSGAFVAGPHELIETLIQQARSYIYTTAMPAANAAACLASLRLVEAQSGLREQLNKLVRQFREGANVLGLPLTSSTTPIQPIVLGDTNRAMHWSRSLRSQGILVTAIRPPTVPEGGARLRVTLSAAHTDEQVAALLSALKPLCQA